MKSDLSRLSPLVKFQIKEALQATMYAATEYRQEHALRNIVIANTVACKYSHQSFSYKGQFYNIAPDVPRYKNQRLMPELHQAMNEYIADRTNIELFEKPYIIGFFNRVLNKSDSILDYLQLLPDSVHPSILNLRINSDIIYERRLSDEQVAQFIAEHADWILLIKKRMILDLVL